MFIFRQEYYFLLLLFKIFAVTLPCRCTRPPTQNRLYCNNTDISAYYYSDLIAYVFYLYTEYSTIINKYFIIKSHFKFSCFESVELNGPKNIIIKWYDGKTRT